MADPRVEENKIQTDILTYEGVIEKARTAGIESVGELMIRTVPYNIAGGDNLAEIKKASVPEGETPENSNLYEVKIGNEVFPALLNDNERNGLMEDKATAEAYSPRISNMVDFKGDVQNLDITNAQTSFSAPTPEAVVDRFEKINKIVQGNASVKPETVSPAAHEVSESKVPETTDPQITAEVKTAETEPVPVNKVDPPAVAVTVTEQEQVRKDTDTRMLNDSLNLNTLLGGGAGGNQMMQMFMTFITALLSGDENAMGNLMSKMTSTFGNEEVSQTPPQNTPKEDVNEGQGPLLTKVDKPVDPTVSDEIKKSLEQNVPNRGILASIFENNTAAKIGDSGVTQVPFKPEPTVDDPAKTPMQIALSGASAANEDNYSLLKNG